MLRDGHLFHELVRLHLPDRLNLILPGLAQFEIGSLWIGNLSDSPLDAGEFLIVLVETGREQSGLELQLVQGKPLRPGIGNLRTIRDVRPLGFKLEIIESVALRVAIPNSPAPGVGVGHEIEHVLHHALEILGLEAPRPCATNVVLALGRDIKLTTMIRCCARVIVPHELIDIDKCQRLSGRVDKTGLLVDELPDLSTGRRGVAHQQIHQFACPVFEFDLERPILAQAFLEVDRALPVRLRDDQHVEVPRHRIPVAVRIMVTNMIPTITQVDVTDNAVDAAKCVVRWHVQVLPPPVQGLRTVVVVAEAVPVRRRARLGRPLITTVALIALNLVDIPIRQSVLGEEPAIGVLDVEVKPPKVARILCVPASGGCLLGIIDHSKMNKVRVRRQPAGERIEFEADRLLHAGHATVDRHPRGSASVQVNRLFPGLVQATVVVPGAQTPRPIEV